MTVMDIKEIKPTRLLATYIKEKGIKLAAISSGTGITKGVLYPSLGSGRGRELRVDEFMKICLFLDVEPTVFMPDNNNEEV